MFDATGISKKSFMKEFSLVISVVMMDSLFSLNVLFKFWFLDPFFLPHNNPPPKKRNSRPDVHCKKGVLRNFLKRPWHATLLKNRLWHRCFPVNFKKFLLDQWLKGVGVTYQRN